MPGRHGKANTNEVSVQSVRNPSSLLIVEDAPIHSSIISHIARKVGFTTIVAHSYDDACKALDAQQFDCITLDLGLGEHVGMDVLRYLSAVRCKAQIIVISQSDKDVCNDMVELGRALDLNACDSVSKSMDLDELREILVRIQGQSPP